MCDHAGGFLRLQGPAVRFQAGADLRRVDLMLLRQIVDQQAQAAFRDPGHPVPAANSCSPPSRDSALRIPHATNAIIGTCPGITPISPSGD